ncbi:MAG: YbhB/YbcL family Raf kinase inhibitor-like protein [Desulfurivibrionaceae bacterium]
MNSLQTKGGEAMELSSSAFKDKETIPVKYTMPGAGGENVSIPLQWSDIPEGTKSFALSIVDPHPVANNWVHWLVVNISPDVHSLPEGASGQGMPAGVMELRNGFGKPGYGGPQPPPGTGEHPYVVTVYALDTAELDVDRNTDLSGFQNAIKDRVLDKAELTGTYEQ